MRQDSMHRLVGIWSERVDLARGSRFEAYARAWWHSAEGVLLVVVQVLDRETEKVMKTYSRVVADDLFVSQESVLRTVVPIVDGLVDEARKEYRQ